MRLILTTLLRLVAVATAAGKQSLLRQQHPAGSTHTISPSLFAELEELSRIVDISYCVGLTGTGIQKPFNCISRCRDFAHFELIKAWNTGPLLSDSCGYIALSHAPSPQRVILAFRGTYSLTNTLADLSTVPQEYVPYPGDDDEDSDPDQDRPPRCDNCTVHTGFYWSWLNTRNEILPTVLETLQAYPSYNLTLVGHSLGGAVAAIASLDLLARGWSPSVTTFGQPRIGNAAMNRYLEERFNLTDEYPIDDTRLKFRRVTHANDPVPLLPIEEWGYEMHAGEIFITKESLPPENADVIHCMGAADVRCIAGGASAALPDAGLEDEEQLPPAEAPESLMKDLRKRWGIPARYKLWQLLFAHRDYFWRLGLCVPTIVRSDR